MKIDWLKPLVGRPGPFATVYLDATRSAEAGDKDVVNRWRAVRRGLQQQGAPEGVLDALEDAALKRTGVAGAHGRVLIADEDQVLVDRVLRNPPAVATGVWKPVPALLQAALAADEAVDCLCVAVDRHGADFSHAGPRGWPDGEKESFEAPHNEFSKRGSSGGDARSARANIESRAEDSWERNAEAVAAEIDRRVARLHPELVLLTGDVRAVNLVREELGQAASRITVEVPGGGRGAGVRAESFAASVEDALDSFRERRREVVLAEFRQDQGREEGAVTSVDDVVAVLARGQVKELVLAEQIALDAASALAADGAGSTNGLLNGRRLWIGPDPMHIASSRSDLLDLGVTDGLEELPAALALLRAAIGQDAGLTFAPEGSVELIEGVGATLRWHDEGTPKEVAATMSGDDLRLASPR
jgi:hypothetical protein